MTLFFRFTWRYSLPVVGAYVLLLLLHARPASGQYLDLTFQPPTQYSSTSADAFYADVAQVQALARDASGRLLVAGRFDQLGAAPTGGLTRLLASGAPDPTFNPGGTGANGIVRALVVLPTGQLLIAGTFTRYNGTRVGRLVRLNTDGTLDATFTTDFDHPVSALAVDGAGRIYAGGSFARVNGQPANGLVRLTAGGAVDAAFVTGQGLAYSYPNGPRLYQYDVTRLLLDPQGRLLVAGEFLQYQGVTSGKLVRVLPSGARDLSFGGSGAGLEGSVYDIALLPTGSLLVAGQLTSYYGATVSRVIRLNAAGGLDGTFAVPTTISRRSWAVAPQPNGTVLVSAGRFVSRLTATGALDATFTPVSLDANGLARVLLPDASGAVMFGGSFRTANQQAAGALARALPTGTLDPGAAWPTFNKRSLVYQVCALPGDSLLVWSGLGSATPGIAGSLLKLGPTGQPDPSFVFTPTFSQNFVRAATSATGSVFASDLQNVQRLTRTGARDVRFNDGTGVGQPGYITDVVPLANGKVLVGGRFSSYNGVSCDGIVRLLPSGAVDPTFQPASLPGQQVESITVRADGHLALVTYADSANTPQGIVGLLPDGALDQAFGNPTLNVYFGGRLLALPDTTLLSVGPFLRLGNMPMPPGALHRITATGTRDNRFQADSSIAIDDIGACTVQPDGAVLFTTINRFDPRLRRLKSDGSLDPTFQPVEVGSGFWGESTDHIVLQSANRIVLGGWFADINGTPFPGLARLTGVPLSAPADLVPTADVAVYPIPARTSLTIRRPTAAPGTARLFDALGRAVAAWPLRQGEQTVPLPPVAPGVYVLRVPVEAGAGRQRSVRIVVE